MKLIKYEVYLKCNDCGSEKPLNYADKYKKALKLKKKRSFLYKNKTVGILQRIIYIKNTQIGECIKYYEK